MGTFANSYAESIANALNDPTDSVDLVRIFADMAEFNSSGGVSKFAKRPVWIGGQQYYSDGTSLTTTSVVRESVLIDSFDSGGTLGSGSDDSAIFQAAVDAISTNGNPNYLKILELRSGVTYNLATHVTVPGWLHIRGNGAIINRHSSNPVNTITSSAVTADTSIPTVSNPGPMAGCAFYFTCNPSVPYYTRFENFTISGFRMAMAFLNPHNTPIFKNLIFQYCNLAVFCYNGSQNYTYEGCVTRGNPMGPLHTSSATCYPLGSLYEQTASYYTDGIRFFGNGASLQGGISYPNFDNWFRDSILRPTTPSYTTGSTGANQGYVYPFADTDVACKPSVWNQAYIPYRNPRVQFSFYSQNMDYRINSEAGIAFVNAACSEFVIDTFWTEGGFSTATSYFTVGSLISGSVSNYSEFISGQPQLPFFTFTGKGTADGGLADTSPVSFINYVPTSTDTTVYPGIARGKVSGNSFLINSGHNIFAGADGRNDAPLVHSLNVKDKAFYDSNYAILKGAEASFGLPALGANTQNGATEFKRAIKLQYDGRYFSGRAKLSMINATTGDVDECEYELQTGGTSSITVLLANLQTINNGDLTITYTGTDPASLSPYSRWQIGSTGVYITVLSINTTTNVMTLAAPVSGLSATHTSDGTAATGLVRANYCKMLTGWVKNGTITTTNASAAVTGTGTKFLRDVKENQHLYDRNTGKYIGQVLSITSDTALTLTANTALVVTTQPVCVRESDWIVFGYGVAPSFASATDLYIYNRKASSNGSGSPTTTLTTASVSISVHLSLTSF